MGKRLSKAVLVYGVVWVACAVLYWGGLATGALGGGGIMGYTLLALYAALPVAGLVSAFLVGRTRELGWWRLAAPLATAVLYALFVAVTFGLSTALGLANVAAAHLATLVLGLVPAAVGLAIGWAAAR